MKKSWLSGRFTFLVIRNADQSVKQFRISKLLLLAIPVTAIIAILSLITSIGWLSSYKSELSFQVEELEYILHDKDGDILNKEASIQNLQNEVLLLSTQTEEMQARIEQIAELEKELQDLISNFSGKKQTIGIQSIESNTFSYQFEDDSSQAGGPYLPVDENLNEERVLALAEETHVMLTQMDDELATLYSRITTAKQDAAKIQKALDTTPSLWPTKSTRITSTFGYRRDPITKRTAFHSGVDAGAAYGDSVYAAGAGKVIETGSNRSEGRYVLIDHGNGLRSKYMHLSSVTVKKKDEVLRGETIGKAGSTGRSTGVHLHFEILKNGTPVDPMPYIKEYK